MADERLKLTASMRYDKNELFDGFVSPRGSFTYTMGEDRNHNLRASFQTGFRNPTTQDLYIGLNAGLAHLVGSSPDNLDRYSFSTSVSTAGQAYAGGASVVLTGRDAYENAYSAASVMAGAPKVANTALVKPEQVTALELGYRGQYDSFSLDISGYYNQYSDFIANSTVLVPKYGKAGDGALSLLALVNGDYQPFQAYTNSSADVSSYGLNIGMDTTVEDFDFGFNYTFSAFEFDKSSDPDFEAGFNTPKHKFKAYLGAENLTDNIGFNINYRWSDSYLWQASFADGTVPSYSVVDMQVNYTVPDSKTVLKLGAANLFNEEYFSAIGTGNVGAQYYISLMFNN
jgi:outer membrane cobalamin receptor